MISLQISTADIMQQIVWIGSSSIRTVRTFVPESGIPGILGVRVTQNVLNKFGDDPKEYLITMMYNEVPVRENFSGLKFLLSSLKMIMSIISCKKMESISY